MPLISNQRAKTKKAAAQQARVTEDPRIISATMREYLSRLRYGYSSKDILDTLNSIPSFAEAHPDYIRPSLINEVRNKFLADYDDDVATCAVETYGKTMLIVPMLLISAGIFDLAFAAVHRVKEACGTAAQKQIRTLSLHFPEAVPTQNHPNISDNTLLLLAAIDILATTPQYMPGENTPEAISWCAKTSPDAEVRLELRELLHNESPTKATVRLFKDTAISAASDPDPRVRAQSYETFTNLFAYNKTLATESLIDDLKTLTTSGDRERMKAAERVYNKILEVRKDLAPPRAAELKRSAKK